MATVTSAVEGVRVSLEATARHALNADGPNGVPGISDAPFPHALCTAQRFVLCAASMCDNHGGFGCTERRLFSNLKVRLRQCASPPIEGGVNRAWVVITSLKDAIWWSSLGTILR